jgi:hypothetical protein
MKTEAAKTFREWEERSKVPERVPVILFAVAVSTSERIIELAAAQWVGVQPSNDGPLVLFRDPVTTSTLALFEAGLTVAGVTAKLEAARKVFGRNRETGQ